MLRRSLPLLAVLALLIPSPATSRDASEVDLKDSRVHVPWADFRAVIDRLSGKVPPKAVDTVFAPVEYLISSCAVSGSVLDGKSARLTARLSVHVLPSRRLRESGWVSVPIGSAEGGALEAVLLDGKPVPVQGSEGSREVLLARTGACQLSLTYDCPLTIEEGTRSLSLDLPRAASAGIDLLIPGMRADVQLNGRQAPVSYSGQGTRLSAAMGLSDGLSLSWSPAGGEEERGEAGPMAPKVFATTGLLVSIKENRINYQYRVDYQIWHQKRTSFSISVPDSLAIEGVQGAGLADWKVDKRPQGSVLTARTSFAPDRDYSLTVDFSQRLEAAAAVVRVPVLAVREVSRESGCIAVQAGESMEVFSADSTSGLSIVAAEELPAWLQAQQDALMRFKYSRPPWRLELDVRRHKDMPVLVAIADEALFSVLLTEDGYELAKVRYYIRNNHRQYLRLAMPTGWLLWSALIDGAAVMPASCEGSADVLIPLRKTSEAGEGGGFTLELVYFSERHAMGLAGAFRFAAPVIDINCQQVNGEVWAPQKYRYSGFGGNMEKVNSYVARYLASGAAAIDEGRAYRNMPVQSNTIQLTKQGRAMALPVEIEVPQQGTRMQFSRKLTIAGEKADLRLRFRRKMEGMPPLGGFVLWWLAFAAGLVSVRRMLRQWKQRRPWYYPLVGLGAYVVLLIANGLLQVGAEGLFGAFMWGVITAIVARLAAAARPAAATASTLCALALAGSMLAWPTPAAAQQDLGNTTVSIPWSDFRQILRDLKHDTIADTGADRPPVEAVVSQAVVSGRPEAKACEFSAKLTVNVLTADRWVEVSLGSGLAILPGATMDNKPAPLGVNADGETILALRGKGAHDVRLRFSEPVEEQAGASSVSLRLPNQVAGSIRLLLDKPGLAVSLNGRPLAPAGSEAGRYVYAGALGSDEEASLSWQQQVSHLTGQAAMLIGRCNTLYSVGPGLLQVRSQVNLSVLHQELRQFTLSVPTGLDIIDLTGPAVAAWEGRDSAGVRLVSVFLKYSVRDSAAFELSAEMDCPDSLDTLALPAISMPAAARQEGTIGVGVLGDIELTAADNSANVLRRDKRELPGWFSGRGDVLFVYQYLSAGYLIQVGLKPHGNIEVLDALASSASLRSVMRDDGKMVTEINLNVRNRGEQFLRLAWKPQWQLWSLYCNGEPARPAVDTVSGELLVPLKKLADQTAQTNVKLVYLSKHRGYWLAGWQRIAYPALNIPLENISGTVFVPEEVSPFMRGGNLRQGEWPTGASWFGFGLGHLFAPKVLYDGYEAAQSAPETETAADMLNEAPAPPQPSAAPAKTSELRKRAKREEYQEEEKMKELQAPQEQSVFGMGGYKADLDQAIVQSYSRRSLEAGLLSIPVDVNFEGRDESFSNVMLKAGKTPFYTFLYRKTPVETPLLIRLLLWVLVAVAGGTLYSCLWSGWTRSKVLNGIAWPLLAALLIARLIDKPLGLDLLVIIPVAFYLYYAGRTVLRFLKTRGRGMGGRLKAALSRKQRPPAAAQQVQKP